MKTEQQYTYYNRKFDQQFVDFQLTRSPTQVIACVFIDFRRTCRNHFDQRDKLRTTRRQRTIKLQSPSPT